MRTARPRGLRLVPLLIAAAIPLVMLVGVDARRLERDHVRMVDRVARVTALSVAANTASLIDAVPNLLIPLASAMARPGAGVTCNISRLRTALGVEGFAIDAAGRRLSCGTHPSSASLPAEPGLHVFEGVAARHRILAVDVTARRRTRPRSVVTAVIDAHRLLRRVVVLSALGDGRVELLDTRGRQVAFVGAVRGATSASFTAAVPGTAWRIRASLPLGDAELLPAVPLSALVFLLGAVLLLGGLWAGRYTGALAFAPGSGADTVEACTLSGLDNLTGLPDRREFRRVLNAAMRRVEASEALLALMMLDIDRFRGVNDTLGYAAGDALIQTVAARLRRCCAGVASLAHLGGDEFAVIYETAAGVDAVETLARRLLDEIARPCELEHYHLSTTASAGVVLFPLEELGADQLIARADTALSHAKGTGRNRFEFYSPRMDAPSLHRLVLESHLRGALQRNEFVLHYQPQYELASGNPVGMEALLRWQHPQWGLVSPAEFVPLLEESGLIVEVGAWVLRRACAQAAAWQREGLGRLRMAVNLSALQLRQAELAEQVGAVLKETGLAPRDLELELTESMLMEEAETPLAILTALRRTGVSIAIDDFGTGYSSLSYLKRFPVDALKIDREFVREIEHDVDDATIVGAIVHLAHSLGFRVVAEGVESSGQLAALRAHGCDEVQGFLFGRPLPPETMAPRFS